ncbi:hypothetical protein C8E83_1939 [Frondihabitans australicus]|uniref:Uncharacterized protein n=1 Tax=Frondihabitans australicus TaxID=386892 RepID=A0A495IH85_9MICO|nr:hypothetical protein C8E83_1939 [Frondihabitans australicus]
MNPTTALGPTEPEHRPYYDLDLVDCDWDD